MTSPRLFDFRLPDLPLENGGVVMRHHARGWWWGPEAELHLLAQRVRLLSKEELDAPLSVFRRGAALDESGQGEALPADVPTVLLVHALTGDARAGGAAGWWEPLIGVGKPLDPTKFRLLCFNNLGSNYGSTGPLDEGWPAAARLSTVDQARALWLALDVLGVERLHLAAGGSLGGMILLAMAALRPHAVERVFPLGATGFSTAWLTGFNHVQRQAIALDPVRGLEVARQLAMLSYRAEPGLEVNQGRTQPLRSGARGHFPIEGYLEHQGELLSGRFNATSYLALLDAMDAHDLVHREPFLWRIRAKALVTDIDTDVLYTPAQVRALADVLAPSCPKVERATLRSPHGHDAFLIEWDQLAPLVVRALAL
jgi:homoserine O-acetyltransferase/O-succinyltransferase